MPLSLQHRHALLLAERTRDISTITTDVTEEVLAANPETSLLVIETALRHADRQAYLANITEALAATPETSLLDIETALRAAASIYTSRQYDNAVPCTRGRTTHEDSLCEATGIVGIAEGYAHGRLLSPASNLRT